MREQQAQARQQRHACTIGEALIQDGEVDARSGHRLCFPHRGCLDHVVAPGTQTAAEGQSQTIVVVDEQDPLASLHGDTSPAVRHGSSTVSSAPPPAAFAARRQPPCWTKTFSAIERPSPVPPLRLVKNGSKTWGRSVGWKPGPWSRITT